MKHYELLVVEIVTQNIPIRVITGYGPQENWTESEKMPFWVALEAEVASAEICGKSVIIQMDANAKLGPLYIRKDPHTISWNGKVLGGIIERHALTVINGLEGKCSGTITRERNTQDSIEKSVIDFILISSDLEKHVKSMHVDEERINVLTKVMKKNKRKDLDIKESDHNTIDVVLDIAWREDKTVSYVEVFKFADKESLAKFKTLTTNTNQLSKIFDTEKDLNVQTKKFLKRLNGFVNQSFKKVKITNKPDKVLESLYNKRRILRSQTSESSKLELAKVDEELAERYSEKMFKQIKDELEDIESEDGGFNSGKLWKLKKKLSPNNADPPTAMKDPKGNLLTTDTEVKNEAVKHYLRVFKDKPMENKLSHLKQPREDLCKERIEIAKKNKTPPWTKEDVINVLKSLNQKFQRIHMECQTSCFYLQMLEKTLYWQLQH